MYDQLRSEYESVKRSAIQPANNFYSRAEPDLFSNTASMMDNRDSLRKGPREDIWPTARHNNSNSGHFEFSSGSPAKEPGLQMEAGNKRIGVRSAFGVGPGAGNPSMALRNLIISPIKRPQLSRGQPQMFTL
ncbi:E3 ubiquitin-protein ligase CCNB1IP1 homolog [Ipomoea triloba]|nr:E3 ubiquitin-protein ligase CCNB1IP1 homolog [Ipomoea triloba]